MAIIFSLNREWEPQPILEGTSEWTSEGRGSRYVCLNPLDSKSKDTLLEYRFPKQSSMFFVWADHHQADEVQRGLDLCGVYYQQMGLLHGKAARGPFREDFDENEVGHARESLLAQKRLPPATDDVDALPIEGDVTEAEIYAHLVPHSYNKTNHGYIHVLDWTCQVVTSGPGHEVGQEVIAASRALLP